MRIPDRYIKFAFILPAAIWILMFTVFPLFYSLTLSFYRIVLGQPPEFIGIKNFLRAVGDYKVLSATIVSVKFLVIAVSLQMILGMALAVLFNQEIRGRRFYRALLTMPLFVTPVALGFLGLTIFYEEGGPINSMLIPLGAKIPWLSHPTWAFIAILLLEVWQWTPFTFLVLLAGLQSLPEEVFESVLMDSSSSWQIFWHITFPMLQPVIIITLLLRLIEAAKIFDLPFSLTLGGPGTATEVYSMLVYRTGLKFFDLGYASALAYLMLFVMMVVITLFFRRMREIYE